MKIEQVMIYKMNIYLEPKNRNLELTHFTHQLETF